jgi:hypothetical protein
MTEAEIQLLLAEWREALSIIGNDLRDLFTHRLLWRSTIDAALAQVAAHNHEASGVWPNHYTQMYAVTQSIAVRRAIVPGKYREQVSLSRLLSDIVENSEWITWDRVTRHVAAKCPKRILEAERQEVWSHWSNDDGDFQAEVPRRDRDDLFRTAAGLLDWTDTRLAHLNPKEAPPTNPTHDQLDASIDRVGRIFNRYKRLLWGFDSDVTRVQLESGWTALLARPLFTDTLIARLANQGVPN